MQNLDASIDRTVLDKLLENLDGDVAILSELIMSFLDDTPQQLAALEQAATPADARALAKGAHTLKSTSMAFGASALSAACIEIHRQAATGSGQGAAAQVRFMKEEFEKVRIYLLQYLKSR